MTQRPDRFEPSKLYRQSLIQVGCPIYVHCSRVCTDRRTGDRFLQLRLVNRSDREVDSIILQIDSYDAWGNSSGKIAGLILPDCKAQPHSIFGEDRLIALGKLRGVKTEVTVESVRFSDGMIFSARASHAPIPLEETDWEVCACGLPHEPEQARCDLCGRSLQKPVVQPIAVPSVPVTEVTPAAETLEIPRQEDMPPQPPVFRPEPILRSPEELRESYNAFVLAAQDYEPEEEEDDDGGVPRWLFVLLCVIGGVALLAALSFLAFFLKNSHLL